MTGFFLGGGALERGDPRNSLAVLTANKHITENTAQFRGETKITSKIECKCSNEVDGQMSRVSVRQMRGRAMGVQPCVSVE